MSLRGKKLGVLLSTSPEEPGFVHGVCLAEAAVEEGIEVFLYCVDEAVRGVELERLQRLAARGLKLYVCAFGAQRRGLGPNLKATYAGLALLSDLIGGTGPVCQL